MRMREKRKKNSLLETNRTTIGDTCRKKKRTWCRFQWQYRKCILVTRRHHTCPLKCVDVSYMPLGAVYSLVSSWFFQSYTKLSFIWNVNIEKNLWRKMERHLKAKFGFLTSNSILVILTMLLIIFYIFIIVQIQN
jgi:hypothetical protein